AGNDAPSLGRVRDLLAKLNRIAVRYAGPVEIAAEPAPPEPDAAAEATAPPPPPSNALPDRETLLTEIPRIAALFRKHEPNSPISYTLDNAVRRARLQLPELLLEMMPEPAQRAAVLVGLGINPNAE